MTGRICLGRGVAEASGGSDFLKTTFKSWDEVSRRPPAGQIFQKRPSNLGTRCRGGLRRVRIFKNDTFFQETCLRWYIFRKTTLFCRPETRDVSRIGDPRPGTYHSSRTRDPELITRLVLTRQTPDPDVTLNTRRMSPPGTP